MITALAVDDNPLALRLTRMLLERDGHRVIALARWSDVFPALFEQDIDVAFIDVNMPGLGGDRLLQVVRATDRGRLLPCILVSTLPQDVLAEKARAAGADGWIQKPLTGDSVRGELRRVCKPVAK